MRLPRDTREYWCDETPQANTYKRCQTDYDYHGKINRDDDDADFRKSVGGGRRR